MQTTYISLKTFEMVDQVIPFSGSKLSVASMELIEDYKRTMAKSYCRHSCNDCLKSCPSQVPVNTIMRYAYYSSMQGREKYAMEKYNGLQGCDASNCLTCDAVCKNACPHGLNIQNNLVRAHSILSLT